MNKKINDYLSDKVSAVFIVKKDGNYTMEKGLAFKATYDSQWANLFVVPCIDLNIHNLSVMSEAVVNDAYEINTDLSYIPIEFEPSYAGDMVVLKAGDMPNNELKFIRNTCYGIIERSVENHPGKFLVKFLSTNDVSSRKLVIVDKRYLIRIPAKHVGTITKHLCGKHVSIIQTDAGIKTISPLGQSNYHHSSAQWRSKAVAKFKEESVVVVHGPRGDIRVGLIATVTDKKYNEKDNKYEYELNVDNVLNRTFALTTNPLPAELNTIDSLEECEISEIKDPFKNYIAVTCGTCRGGILTIRGWNKRLRKRIKVYSSYIENEKPIIMSFELDSDNDADFEKVHYNDCKKINIADFDWEYDKEKVTAALKAASMIMLATENNDKAYLFLVDKQYSVQQRIFLGRIKKEAKYNKSYSAGKLKHPWDVYKYLDKDDMGHFYQLFTCDEYLQCGHKKFTVLGDY